jgi:predicted enzyme related to lactoylglutathione lyase
VDLRLQLVAIDTPDAMELARFYSALTGWRIDDGDADDEWVELVAPDGPTIAFQRVSGYKPPEWPDQAHPQQMHLDFVVDDLDAGEERVLSIGARKHAVQPGESFRVFLDPDDHPFCLVRSGH